MKDLFTRFSNFWSNILGSESRQLGLISEEAAIEHPFSTHSAPFGTRWKPAGNLHSLSMCAVMFVLLFVVGVGNAWGTAPTLSDLDFGTPAVSANFDNVATNSVSNNTGSAVTNNSLSGYGPFTVSYLGKYDNGVQSIAIAAGDNSPMTSNHFVINGSNNGSSVSFARATNVTQGAISFKIAKTSRCYIGLFKDVASGTMHTHISAAVYLFFTGTKIQISAGTNDGTPSGWQDIVSTLPSTDIIDIAVVYNNTNSATTYGGSISIGSMKAHVYVNGTCVTDNLGAIKEFRVNGVAANYFRIACQASSKNTIVTAKVDDINIYSALPTAAVSCENSVTINTGTSTNCSFTLSKSGSQASCDGVATTVTVTPTSGYGTPVVTESGASASPTISGSGNTQTVTYAANTTGTSYISVSCSANNYTITLDNQGATSAGTTSVTATYNSNNNLTSAITKPTKTGWTFGGYYSSPSGTGTQLIDADGNWLASKTGYTDASKNWIYTDGPTLYAKWTCTVTWSVNKATNVYSTQTITYNSTGCKVASVPSGSDLDLDDYCGDKFMGWTSDENYVHGTSNLFTNVAGSPELKTVGNTTFYAVFADYAE